MKILIACLCLLVTPCTAESATCTGLNPVLVSTTLLAFGNYNAGSSTPATANATITAACTVQLGSTLPSFTVAISAGNSGSFTTRKMNYLTANLNYNIYTSSAYTTVWGDGTGSTSLQSYNASAGMSSVSFTAFGNIPTAQFVAGGLYGDTLTITVTY